MSLPIGIAELLEEGKVENQRIEYKEGWDPEPILHTITAFANDYEGYSGGYILIGVKAVNGIPVLPIAGLDKNKVDSIQGEILELCKKCISPDYCPSIEECEYQGKEIIALWCYSDYDAPYYCKEHLYSKESKTTACYIRKGSSTIKATKKQTQELEESNEIIPFDDRINRKAKVSDLKPSLLKEYLNETGSTLLENFEYMDVERVEDSLRLLGGPKEDTHPKNVALLMFSDHPELFLPYSYIVLDYLPDPTGEGMISKEFRGPLPRQIRDCLQYLRNEFVSAMTHKIEGRPESQTIYNYPYGALEELIPNAVLHKDYRIPEPVTIRITKTEIQITSFPGLSPTITDERVEKLDLLSRSYRNKRIAEFLRDIHLVEAKNTGIPKAIKSLAFNGSPSLSFEMPQDREYVTAVLRIHHDFEKNERIGAETPKGANVRQKIISYLQSNPESTLTEIARGLSYRSIPNSLRKALRDAVASGEISVSGKKYKIGERKK